MGNDLMVRQKMEMSFEEMTRAAKAMAQSGYFDDARDISKAMVKVLAGQEMGLGPFSAMSGIHVIKGKPVLGANLIATLIKNDARYDYRVEELTPKVCRLSFYENGEQVGESTFTIQDAKAAGVGKSSPPGKPGTMLEMYPKNMLFARALSNGARWYTPGVFGGAAVYTPDEMDADLDEDGYIIDGEIVEPEPAEAPQPEPGPPAQNGDGDGKIEFWKTVASKIPYFKSWQHAQATAGLLGLSYPQTKDEAAAALMVLEQYASLRADGVEQDEAVFQTMGGSADEEE